MWRGRSWAARNQKQTICRHLHPLLCRSTSSLAVSSPSPRSQRAWLYRPDLLFNGENLQKTMSSIPYQDSVSAIDSVLCSLSVLTSHMKQGSSVPPPVLPPAVSSAAVPRTGQGTTGTYLVAADCRRWLVGSKAFGSASAVAVSEAAETLDMDSEDLELAPAPLRAAGTLDSSKEVLDTLERDCDEVVLREPAQIAEIEKPCVSRRVIEEERAARRQQNYLRRKQRKIETEACLEAALEYKNMVSSMCQKKLAPNVPFVRGLLLGWFEPFRDAIVAEQKAIANKEASIDREKYGPYLMQLSADILAVVAMHKFMALLMKEQQHGYVRVVTAASAIGEAVEQESEICRILNKGRNKDKRGADAAKVTNTALQKSIQKMVKKKEIKLLGKTLKKERVSQPWGSDVQVKVGSRLIDILMNVAYIHPPASQAPTVDPPEVRPALRHELKTVHTKKRRGARTVGVITCDPLVWSSLEKSVKYIQTPYMPMLVEPVKWTSYKKGGYLILRSRLMRTHGAKSQQIAIARHPKSKLRPVFEALNTLGRTSWRINKQVLDVVEKIWAGGGRLGDLVDRDNVEVPGKPDTTDEEELKKWKFKCFKAKRTNSERHSQRCDVELKLSVARKYKDEAKFYYPHNLDFRGRAYPMHPHLNHLGSDLCRGLLEFGEGRPLGKNGLRWLKIHLANVFAGGVDKLSFEGRIAFVDENIETIMDSASKPLEGERWWLKGEDPFQCLATCICLRDALMSGDPDNYVCHLPVQQDGSCNGLQHYAALGRDCVGAASVNLTMGPKPSDVYSGIAQRVKEIMERDALKDPSTFREAEFARMLVDHVDRKLVKQTVMTSVYGVTFIGARAQILNRLEERGTDNESSQMFYASAYAAKVTLEALGEMFKEAKGIMNWLAECAKLIATENEAVKWSSPLGLPVVQPYRKPGWKLVHFQCSATSNLKISIAYYFL